MFQDKIDTHSSGRATQTCHAEELRSSLESIDWDFAEREPAPLIEGIHPYPAKFIGEIPRTLLSVLPIQEGTVVLDPFVGSGTTMVEAQRLGLKAVGLDLNPIACLISRVKTGPMLPMLSEVAIKTARAAKRNNAPRTYGIPNVDHWFRHDVQMAISALKQEINKLSVAPQLLDAISLALSSIIVRVSNQESDTRYAAVNKTVTSQDVFEAFEGAARKIDAALAARDWEQLQADVKEVNTLDWDPSEYRGKVGVVVTSPPYPNAYEYWLYHKYRMWWLGHDPVAVKNQEIGARAHFFKKNHHTAEHFVDQMEKTFSILKEVVIPGGFACFVIGRSKIHGALIDNASIVQKAAHKLGFESVARLTRTIAPQRKTFNLAHAAIKTEEIVVLKARP